ncbi:hypothetical protein TEA_003460 [Camellia sinensis var. sinensis]|uniref:Armadillo repeat-containing domain-containing protein n=2 Tax=Camellia sinensis TaxID=4442 RepID=A0A4S4EMB7_CAMSN|nr:hypothetical protein TEA_003460 [Camellia sinensis var. sinensis]
MKSDWAGMTYVRALTLFKDKEWRRMWPINYVIDYNARFVYDGAAYTISSFLEGYLPTSTSAVVYGFSEFPLRDSILQIGLFEFLLPALSQATSLFTPSVSISESIMFTNSRRQEERTGKYGTPRLQYLQELVSQFQNATSEESKERIVANLANFAYDPYNYTFLHQLNILELFLDCITEPNEKLVEFGVGGICNSCVDPANAAIVTQCGGIPLIIQCLSSPVRNTVNYAVGALYYLCNASNKEEILKPEVVDVMRRYAAAGAVSVSFSNLAQAFLDKHVDEHE